MSSEPTTPRSIIYVGLDVHKDSITIAVLPHDAKAPTRLDRLPNDLPKLKRFLDRYGQHGELRACYEASGAGYVLQRAMRGWGYAELSGFATAVLDGRITNPDSVERRGMSYFGVQGPWYSVGWLMAATVERVLGRPRLLATTCDPLAFSRHTTSLHREAALATRWRHGRSSFSHDFGRSGQTPDPHRSGRG